MCKWYNLIIINIYAPNIGKNEVIKNKFYERLDTIKI